MKANKIKEYANIELLDADIKKLAKKYNVNILYGCMYKEVLYGRMVSTDKEVGIMNKRDVLDMYEVGARLFQYIRDHIKIMLKI